MIHPKSDLSSDLGLEPSSLNTKSFVLFILHSTISYTGMERENDAKPKERAWVWGAVWCTNLPPKFLLSSRVLG